MTTTTLSKIKYITTLAIISLLASCQSKATEFQNGVEFDREATARPEVILSGDELLVSYPQQMEILDSLIIIKDLAASDSYFKIYSTSGKSIASFGRRGRGAGELLSPQNFTLDRENGILRVKDRPINRAIYYDIYAILRGDSNHFRSEEVIDDLQALHIVPLGDNRYLNIEMSEQSRFRLFDGRQELCNYLEVPELLDDDNLFNLGFILSRGISNQAIKPDGKMFVNGGEIGAILEIFSISDTSIKSHKYNPIYKPLYTVDNGFPAQDRENHRGFTTMTATDDYIYTVLDHTRKSGEPAAQSSISVFNWDAEPEFIINTEYEIFSMCVDKAGDIYATTMSEDGEWSIIKLSVEL